MIVITGPGRSGTSFLADLYRNLGFDPGGGWQDAIRAGREQKDVVELNNELSDALNVRRLARPVGAAAAGQAAVDGGAREGAPQIGSERWDLVPELADRFGDRIRELSRQWTVVKDPRFCWTLRIWLAAKAEIDHVVVTLRRVEDVVRSAKAAGMARPDEENDVNLLRSATMFRIGCLLTTFSEYPVPHNVLWFPRYLDDPETLHETLPLPEPVKLSKFKRALKKTVNPDFVHEHGDASLKGTSS